VKEIIDRAEKIVEQQPDSALKALNSVLFPEDLGKTMFNKYNLLLVQAKDKCFRDITGDTVIYAVKNYYIRKKDEQNAALAAFYCARVLHERKETDNAFEAYSTAIELADKTEDYNLKGLIYGNLGILHREHLSYEKTIELNKNAVAMYEKAKNYRNKISALNLIGDCFALTDKMDSAFRYYDESLKLADQHKITELQSSVRQSKGVVYREKGHYEQAKNLFREALAFSPDSVEQVRILMNIAKTYLSENRTDSAKYYLNQALSIPIQDPKLLRFSCLLRSKTEEEDGYYREALKHYKEYHAYTFKVFDSEKNNKLMEIRQKYDFEKLKNTKNAFILKQSKILLTLSLGLLAACIFIIIFYRRSARNRKLLLEAEYKITGLQKMAQEHSEEKQSLRSIILEYFNVLRKAALIEQRISETERKNGQGLLKKFNKIVYEQDGMNWDKLFQVMNQYHNGFFSRIREKYPQLKDMEFRVCCLSCETGFNDTEISIIIGKSVDMVRRLRSNIRKKIGMPVYKHDLYSFLLQELSGKQDEKR
jgi:tetratricopeptide (TPR) repeat protein